MVIYSNRLFKTYLHHLYLSEQGSFTCFYGILVHSMLGYTNIICVFKCIQTAFGFIIIPVHSLRAL